jgi:hypothetical protein
MKLCTRCKVSKPHADFPAKKRARDGKASWCRACFKENWQDRYYANHDHYKQTHGKSRNKLRNEKAQKVYEYLKSHPCVDCGERDSVVLEFDHRESADKTRAVCLLVTRNWSWERIYNEIQKCDVRCANCHRRKTANQFGYRRYVFNNAATTV